jgi:uncharacterized protein DUF5661
MGADAPFTLDEAQAAGEQIGIDWGMLPASSSSQGMDVELGHGAADPGTNVADGDIVMAAKFARAHLNEFPDYCARFARTEAEPGQPRTRQ